jgi:hypothetical protein
MHLYEIADEYRSFLANADSEEFNEDTLKSKLAEITGKFNDKAENIGIMALELQSDSKALDDEINRLSNRKRAIDNKVSWLKGYLLQEMLNSAIDKVPGKIVTLSLRNAPPSVNILDKNAVPENYRRVIPESWDINKSAILENFKTTGEIPNGCEVITNKKSLMIR